MTFSNYKKVEEEGEEEGGGVALKEFICRGQQEEEETAALISGREGEVQTYQERYSVVMDGTNQSNGDFLYDTVYSEKHVDVEIPETAHQISQGWNSSSSLSLVFLSFFKFGSSDVLFFFFFMLPLFAALCKCFLSNYMAKILHVDILFIFLSFLIGNLNLTVCCE